jgi:hypothetical protein
LFAQSEGGNVGGSEGRLIVASLSVPKKRSSIAFTTARETEGDAGISSAQRLRNPSILLPESFRTSQKNAPAAGRPPGHRRWVSGRF